MESIKKKLFSNSATASGGRGGHVTSDDGLIDLDVLMPIEDNYEKGKYTNPEQLFAAAYAACFDGAIRAVARNGGIELTDTNTTVNAAFGKTDNGFGISADITADIQGVDSETAQKLLDQAHQVCPYSKATRGNIDVNLKLA